MRLPVLLVVLLLAACHGAPPRSAPDVPTPSPGVALADADGSSVARAWPIQADDSEAGIAAEYHWISKHYPDAKRDRQSLMAQGGKYYDKIDITTREGGKKSIFFEISSFFGKW